MAITTSGIICSFLTPNYLGPARARAGAGAGDGAGTGVAGGFPGATGGDGFAGAVGGSNGWGCPGIDGGTQVCKQTDVSTS